MAAAMMSSRVDAVCSARRAIEYVRGDISPGYRPRVSYQLLDINAQSIIISRRSIRQHRPPLGAQEDRNPMFRTEALVTIDRPVAEVYAFVTDCRNEPLWHSDAIEATRDTAVGAVQTWVLRFMGRR